MGVRTGTFQRVGRKVGGTCFPAAAANTNGATATAITAAGTPYPAIEPHAIRIQPAGVAVETVQIQIFFNFSDGTTQNFQATFASTNALQDLALGNLLVNAHRDGQTCASVTGNCSSSIASSGANATINWAGFVTE